MKHGNFSCRWLAKLIGIGVGACAPNQPPTTPHVVAPQVAEEPSRPASVDTRKVAFANSSSAVEANAKSNSVPAIRKDHEYTLAELIDFAQSANPATRSAWERAKQAQEAVGAARAAYLPVLSASVLAGYQHTQYPITQVIVPKGYFSVNTYAIVPMLSLKWLLFDFGARAYEVDALSSLSEQTEALFEFAHRKVLFEVTVAYHRLNGRLAQLSISSENLERAKALSDVVRAKRERGLATDVEVALATRDVTQAEYELVQQRSLVRSAESELLRVIGSNSAGRISIEQRRSGPLPPQTAATLETCVRTALERRADIRAAFLQVKAAEARIGGARSMYFPRVGIVAAASEQFVGTSIEGSKYFDKTFPTASVFAQLEWQLLDGGLRSSQLAITRSRWLELQHELSHVKNDAIHQVVEAHNEVTASIERYNAAQALLDASTAAAVATQEAFSAGVVTLSESLRAQTARTQAKAIAEQAYFESLIAAATLAFAIVEVPPERAAPNSRE